jgi:hypothetical protein
VTHPAINIAEGRGLRSERNPRRVKSVPQVWFRIGILSLDPKLIEQAPKVRSECTKKAQ